MTRNQGVFSIKNNKWIAEPKIIKIEADDNTILLKTKYLLNNIKSVIKLNSITSLQKLKEKLRNYRSSGLEHGGEFSVENIVYKS